jgi:hypothetical protein
MQQKPENLFFTKHCWAVVSVFYLSTLSPVIDKAINDSLTKKDIGNLINATLVAMFAASTKAYDPYVYTPKGLPGRDKNDVLSAINDPIINTVQAVQSIESAIQKPSINTISNALQDVNNATNNVKDVATIANTVLDPINLISDPAKHIQSNVLDPINTLFNNNEPTLQVPFDSPKTNLELITRQDTFYKVGPIDSSLLANNKKVKVSANTSIFIDDYYVDNVTNHISFNIGERVFYAFTDHIKLLKNDVQLVF